MRSDGTDGLPREDLVDKEALGGIMTIKLSSWFAATVSDGVTIPGDTRPSASFKAKRFTRVEGKWWW